MVAGRQHVGHRQQQRCIFRDRQFHQGALGLRHADGLGLAAAHAAEAVTPAVPAGCLQALATEIAGVVLPQERRHDQVAGLQPGYLGAEVLDDAKELMPHRPALLGRRH